MIGVADFQAIITNERCARRVAGPEKTAKCNICTSSKTAGNAVRHIPSNRDTRFNVDIKCQITYKWIFINEDFRDTVTASIGIPVSRKRPPLRQTSNHTQCGPSSAVVSGEIKRHLPMIARKSKNLRTIFCSEGIKGKQHPNKTRHSQKTH